jgi:hypothetical protein
MAAMPGIRWFSMRSIVYGSTPIRAQPDAKLRRKSWKRQAGMFTSMASLALLEHDTA